MRVTITLHLFVQPSVLSLSQYINMASLQGGAGHLLTDLAPEPALGVHQGDHLPAQQVRLAARPGHLCLRPLQPGRPLHQPGLRPPGDELSVCPLNQPESYEVSRPSSYTETYIRSALSPREGGRERGREGSWLRSTVGLYISGSFCYIEEVVTQP